MTRIIFSLVLGLAFAAGLSAQTTTEAVEKKFSLTANKTHYCVGENPRYAITGSESVVGKSIIWESSYTPYYGVELAPNQEGDYGQTLGARDGFAFWSGSGSTWTLAQAGVWTKTAIVDGQRDTFKFEVSFCNPNDFSLGMKMSPESGSSLFYPLGSNEVQNIYVQFDGLISPAQIKAWWVVVDNENITSKVNTLQGGMGEIFETREPNFYGSPSGLSIRIPYPLRYLRAGNRRFEVVVEMTNGSRYKASANYIIRPVAENLPYPAVLQSTPLMLDCPKSINAGSYYYLSAEGGDGTYMWYAKGNMVSMNPGSGYTVSFNAPGSAVVTVSSAGMSAVCSITILPASVPAPPPLPSVSGPNNP